MRKSKCFTSQKARGQDYRKGGVMTLDEAIAHAMEKANELKDCDCECAKDHLQLAEWLKELKFLRERKR